MQVTDEMVTAAMRAFERMSSVLRYREKDKWHSCDIMGMRDAIQAALDASQYRKAVDGVNRMNDKGEIPPSRHQ